MSIDLRALLVHVTHRGGSPSGSMHFNVTEYARVGTYRTIQVLDRGFSGRIDLSSNIDILLADLEQTAHNCILPDNAEETGETQEWNAIQRKLYRYGVEVTIEDLKKVPVVVEVEPYLRRMVDEFTQSSRY